MASTDGLKGKRILITSWSYVAFGGAALNAMELAEKLVEFGMVPTFFSYDIEGPLRDTIEKRFNTKVLTDQVFDLAESDSEDDMGNTKIDINDFDYIWVGGNTIPISIINQINSNKKLPKFIFIHMSPLVAYPLDAPLMPDFEKRIASKILSISKTTTTDCIERILGVDTRVDYWKNPVPDEFKDVEGLSGKLRNIAVISSSHPSNEVINIRHTLEDAGVNIEYVGKFNDNVKAVNADFYSKYDLIIGIGKDARYALVSGVPIYVYGRFGGCGFLSDDNLGLAEAYNLSGRGFTKKTADEIAREILEGYETAFRFHQDNKGKFAQDMTIGSVSRNLFLELEAEENKSVSFSDEYINWLVTTQINIMQRMKISHARRHWAQRTIDLQDENRSLKKDVLLLTSSVEKLGREKKAVQDDVSRMYHSLSWRVTKPLRGLSRFCRVIFGRK